MDYTSRKVKCPCCGHLVKVSAEVIRRYLSPVQARIFEAVRKVAPDMIVTADLEEYVYRNVPNGGSASRSIVSANVFYTNRHLKKFGLRVQGKKGRGGGYRLVHL